MTELIVDQNSVPNNSVPASPAVPQDLKPEILGAYKRMLTYQFSGTLLLIALLAAGLLTSYFIAKAWQPPILVLVALSGMLGAFFSALTRLYNVDAASIALISPVATRLSGWHLLMYSFVPPMVGVIAAVVLYIGFISGLVDGGVFPRCPAKARERPAPTCSK